MARRKTPTTAKAAKAAALREPSRRGRSHLQPVGEAPKGTHEFDLAAAVKRMDLGFLQCRDFGHSWRPFTARWMPQDNCYESQLQCQRCKTVRTRFLSRRGEQLSGGYDYAEGYLVKGMGRLTGTDRDSIRLASIQAVLQHDAAEEA